MAEAEKRVLKDERIEDIWTLDKLKKYACPKLMHDGEWYLHCVDCPSRKNCRAGQQAVFLLTTETNPAPKSPEDKKRMEIIAIFSRKDPIRYLLEQCTNMRPQSVYAKVSVWKKNYPDLEEKFHMLEKVRFLWRKPYDSMTVPNILKELYPDQEPKPEEEPYKSGVTLAHEVKELPATEIAPNSKVYSVTPKDNYDGDSISIADFLAESGNEEPTEDVISETPKPQQIPETANTDMDTLLTKLKSDKASYENKIKEIDKQIEAILTVQKLMNAMAQKG